LDPGNPVPETGYPVRKPVNTSFVKSLKIYRRLASAWIHCAGSDTYQVTDPEPEP